MTRNSSPASRPKHCGSNRPVTMNGLDPQAYLADILARINEHKINRLGDLLPWNWSPLPASLPEAA